MKTSEKGLLEIFESEALRLKSYLCPAGKWTIGIGHTGPDVKEGLVITKQQALDLFAVDIARFEKAVNKYITAKISQAKYDALVSFAFNAGDGALEESTLRKIININPVDASIVEIAATEGKPELKAFLLKQGVKRANIIEYNFYKWIWITNPKTKLKEISEGVFNRRKKEARLFIHEVY